MRLILPLPPGVNRTYKVDTRRTKNALYKDQNARDWEVEAGWEIKRQWRGKAYGGPVMVILQFYYPTSLDIDAGIKITLDLLQKMCVYLNDSQVEFMIVRKQKDPIRPRIEIEVGEYSYNGDIVKRILNG